MKAICSAVISAVQSAILTEWKTFLGDDEDE
jgi:hypothetical protein